jgi:hypothetical protein
LTQEQKEKNMLTVTSSETVRTTFKLALLAVSIALGSSLCGAQTGHVPTPIRPRSAPYSYPAQAEVHPQNFAFALVASGAQVPDLPNETAFNTVALGSIALQIGAVSVQADNPIVGFQFKDDKGNDLSSVFKAEKKIDSKNPEDACGDKPKAAGKCTILIGFSPSDDHTAVTATMTVLYLLQTDKPVTFTLTATGSAAAACQPPKHHFLPLATGFTQGDLYPLLPSSIPENLAKQLYNDFDDPIRKVAVNCFYQTDTSFTFFNQFQSIYNAASGATTLNAQVGSLNFSDGMQVTLATNPQVGTTSSSSNNASTGTLTGGVPTLSSTSSAQAAQNVLNGGTFYGEDVYPLLWKQQNPLIALDLVAREGVDLQKFNNTSITATNPQSHTFVGFKGYFQYNSTNNASNSSAPAGSIFLGAMYGYNFMNHSYSVQNGFGGRIHSQLAQVSAGVMLNGTVRLAASYGFGPSQHYIDSTTMTTTTVNNFKKWSVAIAYQSSGSGKSK